MLGTTWDIVRPRYWHPLASLEQSMMEIDEMADRMLRSRFPPFHDDGGMDDDDGRDDNDHDDFFSDLPAVRGSGSRRRLRSSDQVDANRQTQQQQQQQQQQQPDKPDAQQQAAQQPDAQQQAAQQPDTQQQRAEQHAQHAAAAAPATAFSSYSFSNSSVVDDKGRRVVSTRRRYEDSTGRLKALHERQVDGKTLRAVWNRMHRDDAGRHDTVCSSGTPEEFEQAWKTTPFGEAHERHRLQQQPQQQTLEQQIEQ